MHFLLAPDLAVTQNPLKSVHSVDAQKVLNGDAVQTIFCFAMLVRI